MRGQQEPQALLVQPGPQEPQELILQSLVLLELRDKPGQQVPRGLLGRRVRRVRRARQALKVLMVLQALPGPLGLQERLGLQVLLGRLEQTLP